MIKINGIVIPTPTAYQASINDISKADRNANGTMIIERIATKRKLELTWNYITQSDLSSILSLVSTDIFFIVEYPDMLTGLLNTGTFYVGDRSASGIDYKNNIMRYKDFKFNVIER